MIKAEIVKIKEETGLGIGWILKQLGIGRTTYHRWLNWKKPISKGFVHPLKSQDRALGFNLKFVMVSVKIFLQKIKQKTE